LLFITAFSITSVVRVCSWHTPCSTDDGLYEEFGPRPSQLLIKIYTDYTAELNAFKNKEIDLMDWALEPIDYQWFEQNDPTHSQYSTAFYNEFSISEYDINSVVPTNIISVRQAFAHLIDKDYFIKTYLPGKASRADLFLSALDGWSPPPPIPDPYNLQPRTIMEPLPDDPLDWVAAFNLLVDDLGPPVPDPENPGDYMFWWPSPFPTPDPTGMFPPVPDGYLLFFARSDIAERTQAGAFFRYCCEVTLPLICEALGYPRTRLHVQIFYVPRVIAEQQVYNYHRFHLYTGGWSLGRDPGALEGFTAGRYFGWYSPAYDDEVALMLESIDVGQRVNHAKQAQLLLYDDLIPICMWYYTGYKAYLSNWRGMVNEAGVGTTSWWTFLNAHKFFSESCDTVRYGFAGDLQSLNIISAQWYWDWEVLGKVYDTLIKYNPYYIPEDRPWLAGNWTFGVWYSPPPPPIMTMTNITFHLRQDVWWQDVPLNPWRTWPELRNSFTNVQFTPVDLAFSIEYQRDNPNSWNGWRVANVDHVSVNLRQCWNSSWPWTVPGGAVPPWWNRDPSLWQYDFVRDDPTLGPYDIVVYFNIFSPWLDTLHQLGSLPLIPYHIWKWIPIDGSESIDPWAEDLVYGSGPWILLDRIPGAAMSMIPFRNGQSYRGITLEKSYFAALPVRVTNYPPYQVGITGRKIIFKAKFIGVDRMFAHGINYHWTWGLRWGSHWEASMNGTSPTYDSGYIGFGQEVTVYYVVLIPPELVWCNYIKIHVDLHWHIAYCSNPVGECNFVSLWGHLEEGLSTCKNWYSSTLHVHPPDIAGASVVFPYLGADGIVSIKDATLIGLYWMQAVSPVPPDDPTDPPHRADINGDGIVSIKDATQVGLYWQWTWTHNPPPWDS
jgi:hypothetical protein